MPSTALEQLSPTFLRYLFKSALATQVPCGMYEAKDRDSRQHRERLEEVKHPLMRKRVPFDAEREFDDAVYGSDLQT